jgi:hypothetical protein
VSTFDAWAAGFFDGEGTVGVYRQYVTRRRGEIVPYYGIQLSVVQVDPEPLEALVARYGGKVSRHKTNSAKGKERAKHTWRAGSKDAMRRFLMAIRPYSIGKRRQIDLALGFLDTVLANGGRRARALTDAQVAERERIAAAIKAEKWAVYA